MYKKLVSLLLFLSLFSACSVEKEYSDKPLDNYNALWAILDERYSYFELKLNKGVSWRDMYDKYRPEIKDKMTSDELFRVFNKLIRELKDGHVNIHTSFDYGRYWDWHTKYPENYDAKLMANYLGSDYRIAGGLRYTLIRYNGHIRDNVGLLRYDSFSAPLGASNISSALGRLKDCKALIIDIRGNPGGDITRADLFASHFMNASRVVGYTRHKTGKGHNDFSDYIPLKVEPVPTGFRWLRPVVVLTNRGVYSAANDFVMKMKGLPYVTIMGDTTGGGGGLPMTSELPNGWAIRYSSTQTVDANYRHIEDGIDPDYKVLLNVVQASQGKDSMIERAISYINERYDEYQRTRIWRK